MAPHGGHSLFAAARERVVEAKAAGLGKAASGLAKSSRSAHSFKLLLALAPILDV